MCVTNTLNCDGQTDRQSDRDMEKSTMSATVSRRHKKKLNQGLRRMEYLLKNNLKLKNIFSYLTV